MADAQNTIMFQGEIVGQFAVEEQGAFAFDQSTSRITRASGDFTTNFEPGMVLIAPDATTNKSKNFLITAVQPLYIQTDVAPVTATAATVTLQAFTPIGNLTSRTGPSATNPEIDLSHSQSVAREYGSGLRDNGSISFEGFLVQGDAGLVALEDLSESRATDTFIVAYGNRARWRRFLANVSSFEESAALDGAVTFSGSLRISGGLTRSEKV